MMIDEMKSEKANWEHMAGEQKEYEGKYEGAIRDREEEIGLLNRELKELSDKYNFLVAAHNSIQNRFQEEEPRLKGRLGEVEQQLNAKNMEIA